MFKKLKDVAECLGNINGVDYEVDINVRITTYPKLREVVIEMINNGTVDNITIDKEYHVHKITTYGGPFDVWIIDDNGKEDRFADWFFEDIDWKID